MKESGFNANNAYNARNSRQPILVINSSVFARNFVSTGRVWKNQAKIARVIFEIVYPVINR